MRHFDKIMWATLAIFFTITGIGMFWLGVTDEHLHIAVTSSIGACLSALAILSNVARGQATRITDPADDGLTALKSTITTKTEVAKADLGDRNGGSPV